MERQNVNVGQDRRFVGTVNLERSLAGKAGTDRWPA
jgi:hypothetical protein